MQKKAAVSDQIHAGIPGDDAEAHPCASSGVDADNPSRARPIPLACADADLKGPAAAADWVWGSKSAGGQLADLFQPGTTTQRVC